MSFWKTVLQVSQSFIMWLWKKVKKGIEKSIEKSEERYKLMTHKKPMGFPILKLPAVVLDVLIKQLATLSVLQLSFTSKRALRMCQLFSRKYPSFHIKYICDWNLDMHLSSGRQRLSGYHFHRKTFSTFSLDVVNQTIDKNAVSTGHTKRTCEMIHLETYYDCSEDPVRMLFKWAKHIQTIYGFNQHNIYLRFCAFHIPGLDDFLQELNSMSGDVHQLEIELRDVNDAAHVLQQVNAKNTVLVHGSLSGTHLIFKQFNSNHASLSRALDLSYDYIDLWNSTITDGEMNMMLKRWKEDNKLRFEFLSIRRNHGRENVNYGVLLNGLEYSEVDTNIVRQFKGLSDNLKITKNQGYGGYDIRRVDGKTLTIHLGFPAENENNQGIEPNCHTINFFVR